MNETVRKLIIKEPGQDQREFALTEGVHTIGRSRSSTIKLEDPAASRLHCTIHVQGEQIWLTDNNSSIGTELNGKKITGKLSLNDGDVVTVGVAVLQCQFPLPADDEAGSREGSAAGGETRMAPPGMVERSAPGGDEERDTGGMMFEGTRMLDAAELRGLKAGTAGEVPAKKRSTLGVVLVIALLGGLGYFLTLNQDKAPRPETIDVIDNDYAFRLQIPHQWTRVNVPDALLAFRGPADEGEPQVVVYADRTRDNSITPMRIGFTGLIQNLRGTPREWTVTGRRPMDMNELELMFFGYLRTNRQGKAIYLLNGEDRIIVETEASRDHYLAWSDRFSTILQSFTLFRPQQTFDLEPPDKAMRQLTLSDPTALLVKAQQQYDMGTELLRKRGVKLENTYRAVQSFAAAGQMTYALSSRPELYEKAVTEMLHARNLFNEDVKRQTFEITLAFRQREYDTVYWEALKLMQMVPEKAHPAYQEAQRWLKRVPKAERRL